DYRAVGLKVGVEIHRQLDTEHKFFCDCPTILSTKPPTVTFERRLRPTQSELGQIDPAALFEFHKGKIITYEADPETTCLVELDEEPPHPLHPEALDVALTMSMLLHAKPMDGIPVIRKVVIDRSNTTGFQRHALTALPSPTPQPSGQDRRSHRGEKGAEARTRFQGCKLRGSETARAYRGQR